MITESFHVVNRKNKIFLKNFQNSIKPVFYRVFRPLMTLLGVFIKRIGGIDNA